MLTLQAETINKLYIEVIQKVQHYGHGVSSRSMNTLEISPAHLILLNPTERFLTVEGREINPAFAVAEVVWILSGSNAPWIYEFNSMLHQYTDDGILKGAYGPRIRKWRGNLDQLDAARKLLSTQASTRQAIIQIYDPSIDYQGYRDVACTLNHHFLLRNDVLDMHTTMRSQDIWLGMPYDIFTNTIILELMARWLNAQIGTYHHHVHSLHLYKRDLKKAKRVRPNGSKTLGTPYDFGVEWSVLDALLEDLINNKDVTHESWQCMKIVLQSYRIWQSGNKRQAINLVKAQNDIINQELFKWYSSRFSTDCDG